MNDAWYASAFWSAFNIRVNRIYFDVETVRDLRAAWGYGRSPGRPGTGQNCRNRGGRQMIEVYQGDLRHLDRVIPGDAHPVAALDIFDKDNRKEVSTMLRDWQRRMGGDVFIP